MGTPTRGRRDRSSGVRRLPARATRRERPACPPPRATRAELLTPLLSLGVGCLLVREVAGRLELDRRVLHVEVPGQARPAARRASPSGDRRGSTRRRRRHEPSAPAARSRPGWRAGRAHRARAGTRMRCSRTSLSSMPAGVDSSSTLTLSRSSLMVRGMISTPISKEATASARNHPDYRDQHRGHDHGHRAQRVVDDLEEGGPHVQVARTTPASTPTLDQVADHADDTEDQPSPTTRRPVATPVDVCRRPARNRRRRAGPPPARPRRAPRAGGIPRCGRRWPVADPAPPRPAPGVRPGHVGQHVTGIREQRQAARDERAHDLDHQDEARDGEHDGRAGG